MDVVVMLMPWLSAFFVTQLVEVPVYSYVLRHRDRAWLLAFLASAITHPIVFFVFPTFFPGQYWSGVFVAEAFAVLVEAVWLSVFGVRQSIGWAILANGLSVAVGLTLRALFGWP